MAELAGQLPLGLAVALRGVSACPLCSEGAFGLMVPCPGCVCAFPACACPRGLDVRLPLKSLKSAAPETETSEDAVRPPVSL